MRYAVLGRRRKADGTTEKFRSPPDGHFKTKAVADMVRDDLQPQFPTWTFIIEQTLETS